MERPEPEFFADDKVEFVNNMIVDLASGFSESIEVVERYIAQNDPAAQEGLLREVRELPEFKEVENILGTALTGHVVGGMSMSVTPMCGGEERSGADIEAEEYARHSLNTDEKSKDLIDLVGFLHDNTKQKMTEIGFYDSEQETEEMSWRGVWGRLVTNIKPVGGEVLADVADLFDGLVRQKYAGTYDPVDPFRGREARANVSTKTFYDVFAPHLNRAITRSGEDNWTGH